MSPLGYVVTWLVLVALAALSIGSAFLPFGAAATGFEYAVAATQAAIVYVVFMRLKGPPSLKWLFAGSGFVWLLFLFGLSLTDYATRRGWP
jgi:cytochrome c oxidase subunit IV